MNASRKRILIFSTVYLPRFVGGAEVALDELTKRMPEVDFDMITLRLDSRSPRFERVGAVNVYRIGWGATVGENNILPWHLELTKLLFPVLGFWKGYRLCRTNTYDLLWAMMASYNSLAALKLHLVTKIPYILTLQEGDTHAHIRSRMKPLWFAFKMLFARAKSVQVISHSLAQFATEMGAQKVVVIPNGVDLTLFNESITASDAKEQICARYRIPTTARIVVTTGRLVEKNGCKEMIMAFKDLPDDVVFLMCGSGPDHEALVGIAELYKLSSRIYFAGHVPFRELPLHIRAADCFVRASRSEGLGNSFLEAMACGIPVVGTPVGGIPDFLRDNETGFLVQVGDSQSIAAGINRALKADASLRARAVSLIRSCFDWEQIALQMRDILLG
jgi:glycosyltransferase involved in cell wall biosynthesis